jgi:peptidoglycan-N-acetylglucosamine deacetylase
MALGLALALVLVCSIAAALSLPPRAPARLALLLGAWALFAALLAYLFLPGVDLPWRVRRRVRGARRVALTFDDGPHPDTTPAILDALAAAGARATFFLVGSAVERWPALARRIVEAGHEIGNHTFRHRLLVFRTVGEIEEEISACQRAIAPLAPIRWFRPPHGFKPIGLHRALRRHGLSLVSWQGAVRDTDAPGVEAIVERAVALAADGRILLLHDNPSCRGQTAAAVPAIVARYRALGFEFVSLNAAA